jgi:ABC-type Fe3+ transport system substrate-binding protein
MTDVLVYVHAFHADIARTALGSACAATGLGARLEVYGSGSLYQRLGPRRGQPFPDLVWWFGPFAAAAAAADGLLQPCQPGSVADRAAHPPDWTWTGLTYSRIGVLGGAVNGFQDLGGVPHLALADPERSEVGMSILLATLDRFRQADGDAERGWAWWAQRARDGLSLTEDDAVARGLMQSGQATHVLSLDQGAMPLAELAPLPHAIGLAANSRNADSARRMLDWLTSRAAADRLPGSAWQLDAVPSLDVEWTRQQYVATRRRWAASGFGPSPLAV